MITSTFKKGTPGMDIRVGDYVKYPDESPEREIIYKIIRVEKNYEHNGTTGNWIFTDRERGLLNNVLLSDSNVRYLEWCRPTRKPTVIFI